LSYDNIRITKRLQEMYEKYGDVGDCCTISYATIDCEDIVVL